MSWVLGGCSPLSWAKQFWGQSLNFWGTSQQKKWKIYHFVVFIK